MPKTSRHNEGMAAILGVAFLSAVAGVIVRSVSPYLNPFWQLFSRLSIAVLIIYALSVKSISLKKIIRSSKKDLFLMLIRGIANYAGVLLWVSAASRVKIFTLTVLDSVPYSALFGFLFLREKVTFMKIFYTAAAFAGAVLISVKNPDGGMKLGDGEIMLIISGFLLAFRSVSVRWQHTDINNRELSLVMLFLTSFFLGGTIVIRRDFGNVQNLLIPWIFVLTVIGGLINAVIQVFTHSGYRKIDAVLAANLIQVEVVFGLVLGFLMFKEVPDIREISGSLLLIYSVYRINRLFPVSKNEQT